MIYNVNKKYGTMGKELFMNFFKILINKEKGGK